MFRSSQNEAVMGNYSSLSSMVAPSGQRYASPTTCCERYGLW